MPKLVRLGIRQGTVRLVPFQKHWVASFRRERRRLELALAGLHADIQHVGSTAIPGMPAKPVIDITIGLSHRRHLRVAARRLIQAGYWHNHHADLPDRTLFTGNRGIWRTKHVSLTQIGSQTWKNHICFRDYLLTHPHAAARYRRIKQHLARRFINDRRTYTGAKSAFVEGILRLALRSTRANRPGKNR